MLLYRLGAGLLIDEEIAVALIGATVDEGMALSAVPPVNAKSLATPICTSTASIALVCMRLSDGVNQRALFAASAVIQVGGWYCWRCSR